MHRDPLPAKRRFAGLSGSGDALALARLVAQENPLTVVTASAQDAQRLLEEIAWFAPGGRVCMLPDWETLPYDQFSPHQDLVSARLATLYPKRPFYPVKGIRLLPARKFPLDETGRTRFRSRWREIFEGDPSKKRLYRDVSTGIPAAGVEYYLPLFFESVANIFDYLPPKSTLVLHHDVPGVVNEFWRGAQTRFQMAGGDPDRPLLPPKDLFVGAEEFFLRAKDFPRIDLSSLGEDENLETLKTIALPAIAVDRRAKDPLAALKQFLATSNLKVLVTAESPGRRETMAHYFAEYGLAPAPAGSFEEFQKTNGSFLLGASPVAQGFAVPAEGWAIVTEAELYAGVVRQRGRAAEKRSSVEGMLRDLSELKVGDPIVHEQHGIGRFKGLTALDVGEGSSEFLLLEYEGGDKLYVPVSQLGVIGRYSGAQPEEAPLHKLGSGQWDKAKARAAKQVRDTAAELLALYAKRASRHGHAFGIRQPDVEALAAGL